MMSRGSVIVDVAIDQGGCAETSRPTTHAEPTYVVDGVVHYCVANMPGAVANTSTFALNNVTLPYVCAIADKGYRQACLDDRHLMAGLNVHRGQDHARRRRPRPRPALHPARAGAAGGLAPPAGRAGQKVRHHAARRQEKVRHRPNDALDSGSCGHAGAPAKQVRGSAGDRGAHPGAEQLRHVKRDVGEAEYVPARNSRSARRPSIS